MYQRKDGIWCDTLTKNGKTKYFYGKTKADVKRKMNAYKESEKSISVADALDAWEKSKTNITNGTRFGYTYPIRRLKESFGTMNMDDLTPAQVQAFVDKIAAQGYAKSYVERHLNVLNMAFNYCINLPDSTLRFNPCASVSVPASCVNNVRDLADPKYIQIVKDNVDHPFGLFAYLLIYTGLRRGEALALTDADFYDGKIHVTKTTSEYYESNIKAPKSKAAIREVPILKPLADVLPEWKGYLFSADGGKTPLNKDMFTRYWRRYCLDVGLATRTCTGVGRYDYDYKICPHQLRHEYATMCLDAGLDPIDAQELLGHSNEQTTRKIYTHIKESRRQKTTAKLEQYVEENS